MVSQASVVETPVTVIEPRRGWSSLMRVRAALKVVCLVGIGTLTAAFLGYQIFVLSGDLTVGQLAQPAAPVLVGIVVFGFVFTTSLHRVQLKWPA